MTIELTPEMEEAFLDALQNGEQAPSSYYACLRAVLAIVERDLSVAPCDLCHGAKIIDQYAIDFAKRTRKQETVACPECADGRGGFMPDRPLYVKGERADHEWQEYNEHGNSCHYPKCIFIESEHPKS
jgi:hypothetical protein